MIDVNTMVERLETDVRYSDTALVEFHVPLKALRHEAAALIRSQQEENAVLREALEPFAEAVEDWHEMGDSRPISPWTNITVGHLRRARAAGRREG